jgi:hypothetical protein
MLHRNIALMPHWQISLCGAEHRGYTGYVAVRHKESLADESTA